MSNMSEYIFFNIWDGFKMWGIELYSNEKTGECNTISYYGRIKDALQKLNHKNKWHKDFGDGHDYIMQKMKDKRGKGYVEVKNSIYSEYSGGAITLAQLIEEIQRCRDVQ